MFIMNAYQATYRVNISCHRQATLLPLSWSPIHPNVDLKPRANLISYDNVAYNVYAKFPIMNVMRDDDTAEILLNLLCY